MKPGQAIASAYRQYSKFSGRAALSEYGWWALYICLMPVAIFFGLLVAGPMTARSGVAAGLLSFVVLAATLLSIGSIIPHFAVMVRRLHDTGRSGSWMLIGLVPYLGAFVLLVMLARAGTDGPNAYGTKPGADINAGGEAPAFG